MKTPSLLMRLALVAASLSVVLTAKTWTITIACKSETITVCTNPIIEVVITDPQLCLTQWLAAPHPGLDTISVNALALSSGAACYYVTNRYNPIANTLDTGLYSQSGCLLAERQSYGSPEGDGRMHFTNDISPWIPLPMLSVSRIPVGAVVTWPNTFTVTPLSAGIGCETIGGTRTIILEASTNRRAFNTIPGATSPHTNLGS